MTSSKLYLQIMEIDMNWWVKMTSSCLTIWITLLLSEMNIVVIMV